MNHISISSLYLSETFATNVIFNFLGVNTSTHKQQFDIGNFSKIFINFSDFKNVTNSLHRIYFGHLLSIFHILFAYTSQNSFTSQNLSTFFWFPEIFAQNTCQTVTIDQSVFIFKVKTYVVRFYRIYNFVLQFVSFVNMRLH